MNGAKVLGHVIPERGPAGSEFQARHVLGIAAFLPGSALSDGTSSCFPLSLSRSARRPCKPRARCDREIIPLPASKTNDFETSPCRCAAALFDQVVRVSAGQRESVVLLIGGPFAHYGASQTTQVDSELRRGAPRSYISVGLDGAHPVHIPYSIPGLVVVVDPLHSLPCLRS